MHQKFPLGMKFWVSFFGCMASSCPLNWTFGKVASHFLLEHSCFKFFLKVMTLRISSQIDSRSFLIEVREIDKNVSKDAVFFLTFFFLIFNWVELRLVELSWQFLRFALSNRNRLFQVYNLFESESIGFLVYIKLKSSVCFCLLVLRLRLCWVRQRPGVVRYIYFFAHWKFFLVSVSDYHVSARFVGFFLAARTYLQFQLI